MMVVVGVNHYFSCVKIEINRSMAKIAFLSVLFLVAFHQISSQCLTTHDEKKPQASARRNLYTGEQEFSLNLLRAVNRLDPKGNIFFSPYSTYHALLLAYFISAGKTEQFLKSVLHLHQTMDKVDLMSAYKTDKYLTQFRAQEQEYDFSNANRIYVDQEISVRACIPQLFKDEFEKIDFAHQADESRIIINKWVENQTHSMIKDLLPPGSIDQTTNLALVNAGYFKGSWKYEFNASQTTEEIFHISSEKRTLVKMMNMEAVLNYDVSEALGAYALELPYKGETISMYILLPPFAKQDGIANTLEKLTPEIFQNVMKNLTESFGKTVNLQLPKFSLENTIEMTPILETLGVGNLFKSDADFSLLSDKDKLSLGAGIHKAKIDVNEQGSEAAFATALFSFRMMSDEPEAVSFKCDHPFAFILFNKETQTILFIGVLEYLGVGDLFTEAANFSTVTDQNLRLSNALHKAKIEVNEQGTEAAAATVFFSFRSSRPAEPVEFKCDHPFIYIIYDKLSEAVIFMGVFRRPYV
ncbi:hypothetical protein Trydic_g8208 [Trypoxylus dichotomus]